MSQTALATGALRTTTGVNLRSSPDSSAGSLRTVSAGTNVEILEHDPAGWSKVQVGSTVGYIRSDFLRVPSGDLPATFRATTGVNMRSSPSSNAGSLRTVSAGTNVEVIEHDPAGWSKVTVGDTTGFIRSDFLRYTGISAGTPPSGGGDTPVAGDTPATGDTPASGTVIATLKTVNSVNLRSGASTTSSIIRTLAKNTSVDVLANESNGWSKVVHNGTNGYIRSDLLTSTTATQSSQILYTIGNVNLRASASTSSNILKTLPKSTPVDVLGESNGWYNVSHSGTIGHIRADMLTSSPSQQGSQVMRTVSAVNLRASASASSSILKTLAQGATVDVLANESNGWSKVSHNGTNGYIKTSLLSASAAEQAIATIKTLIRVNLRAGPSTTTAILRTLEANTSVDILENQSDGWSRVRVGSTSGYIRSDLLTGGSVEHISWSDVKSILPTGTNLRVVDVHTGISFNIRVFSKSVHADVEPPTRDDSDAMLRTRNGVWSWSPRPVWVTVGSRTFAAALNGMPHDVSTIRDNGINGHFCLWFKDSASNTNTSQSYSRNMLNAVKEAYDNRPY